MPFNSSSSSSVYTGVVADALATAWRDKRYWFLAFFATVLFTGGAMDILVKTFDTVPTEAVSIATLSTTLTQFSQGIRRFPTTPNGLIAAVSGAQAILALAIVLLAIVAFAVACQAGLVYAIGATQRSVRPTLLQALRVGGSAFWPVAALNIIVHGFLWIIRLLAAVVISMAVYGETSTTKQAASIVIFVVAFILTYVANVVHVFSLNAMMLQGAHIREAIQRSLRLLRDHWFVTIETALLLVMIDLAVLFLAFGAYFILALPFVTAMFTAAVLQSNNIFYTGVVLGGIALFGLMYSAGGFTTQLKYAVWTYLYRRLGEGGVAPKMHRMIRQLFRRTTVS